MDKAQKPSNSERLVGSTRLKPISNYDPGEAESKEPDQDIQDFDGNSLI
jgi:hypothetical protein